MSQKKNRREEYLDSRTEDKETYFFIDEQQKIKIKSREIYLKDKKVVHYPFNRIDGSQKYKKITQITYQKIQDPLPRGFIKAWQKGYGFTRILSPILYAIESKYEVSRVVVRPKGKILLKNRTVYLSYEDLNKFYPKMDSLLKVQSSQKELLVAKHLSQYLPKKFKDSKQKYIKGLIYSIIKDQVGESGAISKDDYDAMLELVISKTADQSVESKKIVLATKEKIEKRFLEDGIGDFKKIFNLKTVSGGFEKKWQQFFKDNTWIISNLFSLPALLFADQAYVGGKEIFNTNGKVTDFLYKNNLTNNLAIVELKTHKTELLSRKPYRGSDVYSLSEELSGAVNQVLDQRQNILNDFYTLKCKANEANQFESFSPKCLIIAGTIKDLPENGKRSFEIFRANLYGVEIITFDEIMEKMEIFSSLIKLAKKKY